MTSKDIEKRVERQLRLRIKTKIRLNFKLNLSCFLSSGFLQHFVTLHVGYFGRGIQDIAKIGS